MCSSSSRSCATSILHVVVVVALLLLSFMGSSLASTNNNDAKSRLRRAFSSSNNQQGTWQSYADLQQECQNNPSFPQQQSDLGPFSLYNIYAAFAASSCGVAKNLNPETHIKPPPGSCSGYVNPQYPRFNLCNNIVELPSGYYDYSPDSDRYYIQPYGGLFVQPWYNCFNLRMLGESNYDAFQEALDAQLALDHETISGGMGAHVFKTPGASLHFGGATVASHDAKCTDIFTCATPDAGPSWDCTETWTADKTYSVTNEHSFSYTTSTNVQASVSDGFFSGKTSVTHTQSGNTKTTKTNGGTTTDKLSTGTSFTNVCQAYPCPTGPWKVEISAVADSGSASGYTSYKMQGQVGVWYNGNNNMFEYGQKASAEQVADLGITVIAESGDLFIQDIVKVFTILGVPTYKTLEEALKAPGPDKAELGEITSVWSSQCSVETNPPNTCGCAGCSANAPGCNFFSYSHAQGTAYSYNKYENNVQYEGAAIQNGRFANVTLPLNTYSVVNEVGSKPYVLIKNRFDYTGPLNYDTVEHRQDGDPTAGTVGVEAIYSCPQTPEPTQ